MAPSERSVRNAEPSSSSSLRENSHDDVTDSADATDKGENSDETLRSWENLDEIEAPKPVALRERRGGLEERLEEEHLAEQRRRRSSGQVASQTATPVPSLVDNLDELAAEAGAARSRHDADEKDALERRREGRPGTRKEWMELLYTLSYLTFFSLLGTLARLGLQSLTIYPGAPVALGELWANVAGTAVMGFLSEDRALFARDLRARARPNLSRDALRKEHLAIKKTIPLYIGLTVGFCGSFTTFSSFMRDAFLALSDDLAIPSSSSPSSSDPPPSSLRRSDGRSVEALLAVLILEVATCLAALDFGAHVALAAEPVLAREAVQRSLIAVRRALDPAAAVLGPGCWAGAVLLAVWPPRARWRGDAVLALAFAPLGTLARFGLALRLNARAPAFPPGTFAANVLGTLVLAGAWDVQRAGRLAVGVVGCQVLRGVMDGFCGCLTTVSTWVLEMKGMARRRHAYAYGVGSVGVGVAVVVVVMGSLRWTEGFDRARCGS